MKIKRNIFDLLKCGIAVSVICGCLACEAAPANPQQKPSDPATIVSTNTFTNTPASEVQEIKDQLRQLNVKEHENYTLVLEGQRKTIDWWFSFWLC